MSLDQQLLLALVGSHVDLLSIFLRLARSAKGAAFLRISTGLRQLNVLRLTCVHSPDNLYR